MAKITGYARLVMLENHCDFDDQFSHLDGDVKEGGPLQANVRNGRKADIALPAPSTTRVAIASANRGSTIELYRILADKADFVVREGGT